MYYTRAVEESSPAFSNLEGRHLASYMGEVVPVWLGEESQLKFYGQYGVADIVGKQDTAPVGLEAETVSSLEVNLLHVGSLPAVRKLVGEDPDWSGKVTLEFGRTKAGDYGFMIAVQKGNGYVFEEDAAVAREILGLVETWKNQHDQWAQLVRVGDLQSPRSLAPQSDQRLGLLSSEAKALDEEFLREGQRWISKRVSFLEWLDAVPYLRIISNLCNVPIAIGISSRQYDDRDLSYRNNRNRPTKGEDIRRWPLESPIEDMRREMLEEVAEADYDVRASFLELEMNSGNRVRVTAYGKDGAGRDQAYITSLVYKGTGTTGPTFKGWEETIVAHIRTAAVSKPAAPEPEIVVRKPNIWERLGVKRGPIEKEKLTEMDELNSEEYRQSQMQQKFRRSLLKALTKEERQKVGAALE